jgi:hypothetical protein
MGMTEGRDFEMNAGSTADAVRDGMTTDSLAKATVWHPSMPQYKTPARAKSYERVNLDPFRDGPVTFSDCDVLMG